MYDKEKKTFYESATQNILSNLDNMKLSKPQKKEATYLVLLFREAFKLDEIKRYIFITPENKLWNLGYDSAGFCRVASVAFSLVMGIKDWQLMCIDKNQWQGQTSHHYLKHVPSDQFLDITYDQFSIDGYTIPYELGHIATFGIHSGDLSLKFAEILGINLLDILKKQSKGK